MLLASLTDKPVDDSLHPRPTTNAPKPNIRFLKNIIKETDSHNAALRVKEAADARERLRSVNGHDARNGQPRHGDDKRRDVDGHSSKKWRLARDEDRDEGHRLHTSRASQRHRHSERHERRHGNRHKEEAYITESEAERSRHRRHRHRRHNRSPSSDSNRERRPRHRHRYRSRSPKIHHHSHHHRRRFSSSPSPSPKPSQPQTKTRTDKLSPPPSPHSSASDSDPLTSLIGPLPPSQQPLPRGRGAFHTAHSSTIDTHFTPSYDPSTDIQPTALTETESLDWDNALEALRDRARWKASGAERLRAAGFTDEEIGKWERGPWRAADEEGRAEECIRWKGRGEGREWDRGKVVGDKEVEVQVEWGRLKGT